MKNLHCVPLVTTLVLTSGCMHTITVLAPASDVPSETPVAAAITEGHVAQSPRDAILRDGAVVSQGKTIAHVAPTDTVAVAAVGGDDFGDIHVHRKIGYDFLVAAGLVVFVGGIAASAFAGTQCNAAATRGESLDELFTPECYALTIAGLAASATASVVLIALGTHGTLTVTTTGVAGRF